MLTLAWTGRNRCLRYWLLNKRSDELTMWHFYRCKIWPWRQIQSWCLYLFHDRLVGHCQTLFICRPNCSTSASYLEFLSVVFLLSSWVEVGSKNCKQFQTTKFQRFRDFITVHVDCWGCSSRVALYNSYPFWFGQQYYIVSLNK